MSFSWSFENGVEVQFSNRRPKTHIKRLQRSSRPAMAERYSEEGEHQEEKQFCFPLTVDPSSNFTTSTFSLPSTSSLEHRPISVSSESSTSSSPCMVVDLTTEEDDDVVDLTSPAWTSVRSLAAAVTYHHTETSERRCNTERRERREPDDVVIIHESDDEEQVVREANRQRFPSNTMTIAHINSAPQSVLIQSTPPKSNSKHLRTSSSPAINLSSKRMITCPICMDTAQQFEASGRRTVVTVCGHIFCNVCIRNAISTQHKCPTCRKKLSLRQYHPIFL